MKNTKKILIASAILMATTSGTYAMWFSTSANSNWVKANWNINYAGWSKCFDESTWTNKCKTKEERKKQLEARRAEIKKTREEFKSKMKANREERKDFIKKNKEEIKANIKSFREEHKGEMKKTFKNLDKTVKAEIKTERKSFHETMKKLKEEIKAKKWDFESRKELMKKIEEERENHFNKLEAKLANNPEALAAIKVKKEVFEKNKALREEMMKKREEFRIKRWEMVEKYKTIFINKLGNRIKRISTSKLKKILPKIDQITKKIENNKRLTKERKDRIINQLQALKEIIEDRLAEVEDTQIDTSVEAILND